MKLASPSETRPLLAFVSFLLITAFGFGQTQLHLKPGSTYKGISNNTYASQLLRKGQPLDIKGTTTIIYNIEVKGEKEGLYSLENTITALIMDLDFQGTKIHFDSRNSKTKKAMPIPVKGVVNNPIHIEMDKSGKIIKNDLNKIDENVRSSLSFLGGIAFGVDDDFGTHLLFTCLPDNPEAGQTWTISHGDNCPKYSCKITSAFNDIVTLEKNSNFVGSFGKDQSASGEKPPLDGTFLQKTVVDKSTNINKSVKTHAHFRTTEANFPLQMMTLHSNTMIQQI